MKYFVLGAMAAFATLGAAPAGALVRIPTTVTTNAPLSFAGSLSSLNNGVYPANTTSYSSGSVFNFPTSTYFDFSFGSLVSVAAFNLAVDNNDDYTVQFFNAGTLVATRTIGAAQGVVTANAGGIETFSSDPTLYGTFLSNLQLVTPVQATFARVRASGGDGAYGISEVGFQANNPVPEPATWAMMMIGFAGLGFVVRRRPNTNLRVRFN